jgi:hypothetical protein
MFIPCPPLKEQNVIVQKIKKLNLSLDEIIENFM